MANWFTSQLEKRGLVGTSGFFAKFLGTPIGATVSKIDYTTATTLSSVYRCVNLISDHISTLPLYVMRRGDDGWETTSHPIQSLFRGDVDQYMNGQLWRQVMMANILLRGNAFYIIHRTESGLVTRLEWVDMVKVQILQDLDTKVLTYQISDEKGVRNYTEEQVLHFRGFTLDGIWGSSPIDVGAESLGVSRAALNTLFKFYNNGAIPSGILQLKGTVRDKERLKDIGKQFDYKYSGDAGGQTAVLTEGAEYKPLQVNQRDSQFIETLNFGVQDVARWYGVPLNKLFTQEASAQGAGIEAEDHAFLQDTLRPWIEKVEYELNNKLLPRNSIYKIQIDLSELQRGSMADRVQWAVSLANIGVVSKNEIRERFGLNSVDGGDELIQPTQYSPTGDIENGKKNREDEQDD